MLTRKKVEDVGKVMPRIDPYGQLRKMALDLDRMVSGIEWPFFQSRGLTDEPKGKTWFPELDIFEKDGTLVAKVDLPGLKKEDVTVEVADGYLTISGQRRTEAEERKEAFYRCEREFGSFVRTFPLPEGTKFEDVKATFADGVLEVTVPLPAPAETTPHKVLVEEVSKQKTAA